MPDPVTLADRDVRRLLPLEAGLQDSASLRTRLAALLETLYGRVLAAEAKAVRMKEYADALDRNWNRHHSACVDAIRTALDMPDASIPDMVARIREIEADAARLRTVVEGHEKAYALLLAGMGSSEEQRTALKLRVRELEAARVAP